MSPGISQIANTARPVVGVLRTSKKADLGAPAGRESGGDVGGAEEEDDGRDTLSVVWIDAGAEGLLEVVAMTSSRNIEQHKVKCDQLSLQACTDEVISSQVR